MTKVIALRAMFGQDEANHGTARYCVDQEGLVRVPPEAAPYLTHVGGFAPAEADSGWPPEQEPAGSIRLHHDSAGACSYGGRQYQGDADGDVLVPAPAAAELMAHGYVLVLQTGETPPWPAGRAANAKVVKE